MRRKRYPQTQNRMVYKDKDHREIIMDDNYHGAVYIDDEDFPAWRKYKPRLLSFNFPSYTYKNTGYAGCYFSVDTENKYFSMGKVGGDGTTFVFGNIYYRNTQGTGGVVRAYASLNGYDWKAYESSMFLDPSNYVGGYGNYVLMRTDDYYELYEITYNPDNNTFSSPTLVGRTSRDSYDVANYLGQISTESCQGALFSYTRNFSTYRIAVINLVTGTDFSVQPILNFRDDTTLVTFNNSLLYSANNQYMIFIRYQIQSRKTTPTDGSYTIDYKGTILHSESGAPGSWIEDIVMPQRLAVVVDDNERNQRNSYTQEGAFGAPAHILYSNSMYYMYMECDCSPPHRSWENYYKNSSGQKVIYATGSDPIQYYLVAFRSSDFINWEKCILPQYLDIAFPCTNKEFLDIIYGYYGYGAMYCGNYQYLRLFLDARRVRGDLDSWIMPSEQFPSFRMAAEHANPFGSNYRDGCILQTEVINGTVQRSGNLDNNDIWIVRQIELYGDTSLLNMIWKGFICINVKDPLFQHSDEDRVYLLNNSPEEAGSRPRATSNVDPLDPSDYVFG